MCVTSVEYQEITKVDSPSLLARRPQLCQSSHVAIPLSLELTAGQRWTRYRWPWTCCPGRSAAVSQQQRRPQGLAWCPRAYLSSGGVSRVVLSNQDTLFADSCDSTPRIRCCCLRLELALKWRGLWWEVRENWCCVVRRVYP